MKVVILSIMVSLESVNFHPLLNLISTGDFSTNCFVCLSQTSLVYVDFSKILLIMQ